MITYVDPTHWKVRCNFFYYGVESSRRVSIEVRLGGHWETIFEYMKQEDRPGLSIWAAPTSEAQVHHDTSWGRSGSATYPVPDDVFREVFHLLYTVPHPGTGHAYTSVVYATPA